VVKKFSKVYIICVLVFAVVIGAFFMVRAIFPLKYAEFIVIYSAKHNLNPYLVTAVIKAESGFDPSAHSKADAIGLMQITLGTGANIHEKIHGTTKDFESEILYDPEINIQYGTWYLSWLSSQFDGNIENILAAYNAGIGNVNKWLDDEKYSSDGETLENIPFEETDNFVNRVKLYRDVYSCLYGVDLVI